MISITFIYALINAILEDRPKKLKVIDGHDVYLYDDYGELKNMYGECKEDGKEIFK